jgi:hypothetical protein
MLQLKVHSCTSAFSIAAAVKHNDSVKLLKPLIHEQGIHVYAAYKTICCTVDIVSTTEQNI